MNNIDLGNFTLWDEQGEHFYTLKYQIRDNHPIYFFVDETGKEISIKELYEMMEKRS